MEVLRMAEQIGLRTLSLTDTLQTLRRQLSSARPLAPFPNSYYSSTTVEPAVVNELSRHLDRYVAFIRTSVPDAVPLTKDPFTKPMREAFSAFYFEKLPVAAVLTTYTRLEAQIRRYSEEALRNNAQKVGSSCCFCFDRIALQSVAESNTVVPGGTYRSQLFLSQSISDVFFSEATVNGKSVELLYPGHAKVAFRTPQLNPGQPDTLRAQWQGVIRARDFPYDTAWRLTVPYFIIIPAAR
ncbi:hypothetical protein GCM10023185_23600 [Hymenobacter saemangeumensis]|uniref:Uncharacterized protein n=2 Tax=Hymenobacter saemangeumensis TaxID=1084522 RepID=A0ABP8IG66_9BACT